MFYLFGFSVNVTWFNPPICTNAKAKVGDYLVNLIRNSFTSLIKFSKLFSRNTINRSCNCMPNTKAEKSKHNKNLLEKVQKTSRYPVLQLCNKNQRPLKGQLLRVSSTKLIRLWKFWISIISQQIFPATKKKFTLKYPK